jgi:2-oxoglutarate ferredoxin oxidoreductase subunit alpha
VKKIRDNAERIIDYDSLFIDDAEVVVVAYGISVRSARRAIANARDRGINAGLVKLNTVWPFPEEMIRDLAGNVRGLIMPEINMGQMVLELERCAGGRCPVHLVPHCGGTIIKPAAIISAIESILEVV